METKFATPAPVGTNTAELEQNQFMPPLKWPAPKGKKELYVTLIKSDAPYGVKQVVVAGISFTHELNDPEQSKDPRARLPKHLPTAELAANQVRYVLERAKKHKVKIPQHERKIGKEWVKFPAERVAAIDCINLQKASEYNPFSHQLKAEKPKPKDDLDETIPGTSVGEELIKSQARRGNDR